MTGPAAPPTRPMATPPPDGAHAGWLLEILHIAGGGDAERVWLGPWPDDPEREALALGRQHAWPGGRYAVGLVADGELRSQREVVLALPGPPPPPADPWAGADRALRLATDLHRLAARRR